MSLVLIVAFIALMVAVIPVAHALVIASGIALLWDGQPAPDARRAADVRADAVLPDAGPSLLHPGRHHHHGGRLGEELLKFSGELLQRVRGGALSTTVVGSVVFGGVSGSAVANASALGSVLIPWQKRQGYPAGLCAANNATSAVIDILIPPSIPMILYAVVSGVSIGDLFMAGVVPGILMALGFIGVCWWNARRLNMSVDRTPLDPRKVARLAFLAMPALALPVLILVALRFGFATPTEIAVMAVLYALVMSLFLYRDMSVRRFRKAMIDAGVATGIVMMVIMGSAAASWI
jgi:tripartite ATP-independent transporter DctM subunit